MLAYMVNIVKNKKTKQKQKPAEHVSAAFLIMLASWC